MLVSWYVNTQKTTRLHLAIFALLKDEFVESPEGQARVRGHEDLQLLSCPAAPRLGLSSAPGERKWKRGSMAVPSLFLSELGSLDLGTLHIPS